MIDFDHMKAVRLPNWGRWGRQDDCRPDPQRLGSVIAGMMRRGPDDWDGPVHAKALPILERDAEELDRAILKLPVNHRETIKRAYYRRERVRGEELDAAVRALCWSLEV